ncbi:MAG: hypothetical protein ACX94C_11750 [Phycisphaerales bacterium]
MPLLYSTDIQDAVAALLGQSTYDQLTADQQKAIDGASAASPPTKGAAKRALSVIAPYANAYAVAAESFASIPDAWEAWFIHQVALLALPSFQSADRAAVESSYERVRRDALVSYASTGFGNGSFGNAGALSVANLTSVTITSAVRAADSVILDPIQIGQAIESVVVRVWNDADWSFKEVIASLSIATDGTVSVGDSLAVKKLIDDRILYTGDDTGFCAHVDWRTILDYRAGSPDDGKPRFMHLRHAPDDLDWTFDRTPDKAYTAKGTFTLQTPTMSDIATMNSALAQFPVDFRPLIKKMVLAEALRMVGRVTVPARYEEECRAMLASLMPRYDRVSSEAENSAYEEPMVYGLGPSGGFLGGNPL